MIQRTLISPIRGIHPVLSAWFSGEVLHFCHLQSSSSDSAPLQCRDNDSEALKVKRTAPVGLSVLISENTLKFPPGIRIMQQTIIRMSSPQLKQCSSINILVKQLNDNCQSDWLLFFFLLDLCSSFGCVVCQLALASWAVNLLYSVLIPAFKPPALYLARNTIYLNENKNTLLIKKVSLWRLCVPTLDTLLRRCESPHRKIKVVPRCFRLRQQHCRSSKRR